MPSMNVEHRQAELEEFLAVWFADPKPQEEPPCSRGNLEGIFGAATGAGSLGDDEILDRAPNAVNGQKFTRLFNGDTSAHPSQSEADLAFCDMLAFWTGRDADQVDRLFRQSGLQANDLAIALNGIDLRDQEQAQQALQNLADMTEITLTVEREGQRHDIAFALGDE